LIFSFKKYVTPTSYFNLKPIKDHGYFPDNDELITESERIPADKAYKSFNAQERDRAYRAFQMGYIGKDRDMVSSIDVWEDVKIPVVDEYRFLRKYYHRAWPYFALLYRIVTLKNPIRELRAFIKSRTVNAELGVGPSYQYPEFESYHCDLIEKKPFISVIIPTLNRYEYLKDVFKDLEKQTYKHFEVIVVDQSEPFDEEQFQGWDLDLKYWYQSDKALWKARNDAIRSSKGDFILLYDDDSLIEDDWIEQHLKCIEYFDADISSGVSISVVGAAVPAHYSYFRWSDQLDTGNALVKREVFETIGLFDRQFEKQRMGDGEFGLRSYLNGIRNISNPRAKRVHLKAGHGGLRHKGGWDAFRPKNFWDPRPMPSVLYLYRKYFGFEATMLSILKHLPPSIVPYRLKRNRYLLVFGALVSVFLIPVLFLAVARSWRSASRMLNEGAKIDNLEPKVPLS